MDRRECLQYVYDELMAHEGYYDVSYVCAGAGGALEFCSDDVHAWGREEEFRGVYGLIRDLVKVRVLGAMESGKLDRTSGNEILRTYYYTAYKEGLEAGGAGGGTAREIVVRFV